MIVHFYATLREVVGRRQVDIPLAPGGTLRQLIADMVKLYPGLHQEILDSHGNLYNHIHIFVNGRESSFLKDNLDSILEPGDILSIFPPVGGG